MRILIVEDLVVKLRTVQSMLGQIGEPKYDVANNSHDAFKFFQENQYDLVVLDLGFCRYGNDDCGDTYDPIQGLLLFEAFKAFSRRKNRKMPDVIVYSETALSESDQEGLFGKADTEEELYTLLVEWKFGRYTQVLVVEDSEIKTESILAVLSRFENVKHVEATCAKEAKKIVDELEKIDILIVDMTFPWHKEDEPKDNGVKLIKKICKQCTEKNKKMPQIIVYSIIPYTEQVEREGEKVPATYVGQTFFQDGLEEILNDIIG